MAENGKFAWIIEKRFAKTIGSKEGQNVLRVVVDKEGRVVTAFPVERLLKRIAIKGIQVSAQLAVVALLTTIYEKETHAATADTAARHQAEERSKPWIATALEWIGPFGIFESSPIGLEPNFAKIKERTASVISEAESNLGRSLTTEESGLIRRDVYNIWAGAVTNHRR